MSRISFSLQNHHCYFSIPIQADSGLAKDSLWHICRFSVPKSADTSLDTYLYLWHPFQMWGDDSAHCGQPDTGHHHMV